MNHTKVVKITEVVLGSAVERSCWEDKIMMVLRCAFHAGTRQGKNGIGLDKFGGVSVLRCKEAALKKFCVCRIEDIFAEWFECACKDVTVIFVILVIFCSICCVCIGSLLFGRWRLSVG